MADMNLVDWQMRCPSPMTVTKNCQFCLINFALATSVVRYLALNSSFFGLVDSIRGFFLCTITHIMPKMSSQYSAVHQ